MNKLNRLNPGKIVSWVKTSRLQSDVTGRNRRLKATSLMMVQKPFHPDNGHSHTSSVVRNPNIWFVEDPGLRFFHSTRQYKIWSVLTGRPRTRGFGIYVMASERETRPEFEVHSHITKHIDQSVSMPFDS